MQYLRPLVSLRAIWRVRCPQDVVPCLGDVMLSVAGVAHKACRTRGHTRSLCVRMVHFCTHGAPPRRNPTTRTLVWCALAVQQADGVCARHMASTVTRRTHYGQRVHTCLSSAAAATRAILAAPCQRAAHRMSVQTHIRGLKLILALQRQCNVSLRTTLMVRACM